MDSVSHWSWSGTGRNCWNKSGAPEHKLLTVVPALFPVVCWELGMEQG